MVVGDRADGAEELERLRALVAAIPDPIYRVTADGTFLSVEVPDDHPDAMPQDSIPGQSVREVMPRAQGQVVMAGIHEALAAGGLVTVEYHLDIDGLRRWWEARLVPVGGEVLAIVREITDRRRSEAETLRQARTDPLTGLANRSSFVEDLDHAIARRRRSGGTLAVMYCDLDNFKAINDAHGHARGDAVLAKVATRIEGVLRDVDLAARLGGDELAIMCEELNSPHALEAVGLRIIDSVSAPCVVDGDEHHIGISIGVAVFPDDGDSAHDLIEAADTAMYRAKARGGSQVAWGGHLD